MGLVSSSYRFNRLENSIKRNNFSENDKNIMMNIIKSFGKTWKLMKLYPEALENHHDVYKQFHSIFVDMLDIFQPTLVANGTYICEDCDMVIPIRNNDFEYSYQVHIQSPEHKEVLQNFELLDTSSTDCVLSSEKPAASTSEIKNDFEDDLPWIVCDGEKLRCILCDVDVTSKLKEHFKGNEHSARKFNYKNEQNLNLDENKSYLQYLNDTLKSAANEESEKSVASVNELTNEEFRMWIYMVGDRPFCTLCYVDVLEVQKHIKGIYHRMRKKRNLIARKQIFDEEVAFMDECSNIILPSTETYISFAIKVIDNVPQCYLCGKDLTCCSTYLNHVASEDHKIKVWEFYTEFFIGRPSQSKCKFQKGNVPKKLKETCDKMMLSN